MRVQGSGLRVWELGVRVQGLGVHGIWFSRVWVQYEGLGVELISGCTARRHIPREREFFY